MCTVEAFRLHRFTISLKVITTLPISHHTVVCKTMMIGTLHEYFTYYFFIPTELYKTRTYFQHNTNKTFFTKLIICTQCWNISWPIIKFNKTSWDIHAHTSLLCKHYDGHLVVKHTFIKNMLTKSNALYPTQWFAREKYGWAFYI